MRLKEYIWVFENELGDFFCKDVIKLGTETTKHFAYINDGNNIPNKKIRDSKVCFLSDYWIKEWFDKYFHTANKNAGWNFQFNKYENFQFTEYKKNQHYGWHPDSFLDEKSVRKLSAIITLSDPKDYIGGEIEFCVEKKNYIKIGRPPKGSIIIFPSFIYHRVKPVKEGKRYSLVVWAHGDNFK